MRARRRRQQTRSCYFLLSLRRSLLPENRGPMQPAEVMLSWTAVLLLSWSLESKYGSTGGDSGIVSAPQRIFLQLMGHLTRDGDDSVCDEVKKQRQMLTLQSLQAGRVTHCWLCAYTACNQEPELLANDKTKPISVITRERQATLLTKADADTRRTEESRGVKASRPSLDSLGHCGARSKERLLI